MRPHTAAVARSPLYRGPIGPATELIILEASPPLSNRRFLPQILAFFAARREDLRMSLAFHPLHVQTANRPGVTSSVLPPVSRRLPGSSSRPEAILWGFWEIFSDFNDSSPPQTAESSRRVSSPFCSFFSIRCMSSTSGAVPFSWSMPGGRSHPVEDDAAFPVGPFSSGKQSSTGKESVDPHLVQETKNEIRALVQEITSLARSQASLEEFQEGFLRRLVSALAACGGAIWLVEEQGTLAPNYQIGLAKTGLLSSEDHRRRHEQLLRGVIATAQPSLAAPQSGAYGENPGGNPSDYLLVLAPLIVEQEPIGVIEVFQRPGAGPTTQRGYLRFLVQMTELAGEYLKSRRLRALYDQQSLWRDLEEFIRAAHGKLDVTDVCFAVANEGRRLIGCDRVSVVLARGRRFRVECVSGLDTLDRRADEVRRLARLAGVVAKAGEPFWTRSGDEPPPQIEQALAEFVDSAHARMVGVLPLRRGGEGDSDGRPGKPFGALVIERFHDARIEESLKQRAEMAAAHGGDALANAIAHSSLFLLPVWKALGKATALLRGNNLWKTAAAAGGIACAAAALTLIPADFELASPGILRPANRHEIYAAADGVLVDLPVEHEQAVSQGQVLARLRNTDLEVSIASVLGAKAALEEQVASLERVLLRGKALGSDEQNRLAGELLERREELAAAERQLELYRAKEEQLVVRSPADGQIVTWQVRDLLAWRPVARGQNLMTVVAAEGDWELELHVPEKRMGHIAQAWRAQDGGLPVRFVLATHPDQRLEGRVVEIRRSAEVTAQGERIVKLRAAFDRRQAPDLRDGAGVTAQIHCGRRPLGYVLFHELFEAVQEKALLWF